MNPPLSLVELLWLIGATLGGFLVLNAIGARIARRHRRWRRRRR